MAKKSFRNAIDKNTNLIEKTGVNAVFSSTEEKKVTPVIPVTPTLENSIEDSDNKDIRQTFIIREVYFDKLKDFIHLKKINDYTYNQKDAIHEALELLFSSVKEIPKRPDYVRKAENKRIKNLRDAKKKIK